MKSEKFVPVEGFAKFNLGCSTVIASWIIAGLVGIFFFPVGILIFLIGLFVPFFQKYVSGICPKCEKQLIADKKKDSVKCSACKSTIIIDQENSVFKYLDG